MWRAKRRRAHAVNYAGEGELQLVGFVQRNLQNPRDDLRAARQALRRCINHRQSRWCETAVARHFFHDLRRWRTPAFDNQRGKIGLVSIADIVKHTLLLRQCASRARAEREKSVRAGSVRQAPARVLAA